MVPLTPHSFCDVSHHSRGAPFDLLATLTVMGFCSFVSQIHGISEIGPTAVQIIIRTSTSQESYELPVEES